MKGPFFGPRSEVPQTNLLPGAGKKDAARRSEGRRRWLLAGLLLGFLLLLGLVLR